MTVAEEVDLRKALTVNDVPYTSPVTGKTYMIQRTADFDQSPRRPGKAWSKQSRMEGIARRTGVRARRKNGKEGHWFTRMDAVRRCEQIERES